MRDLFPGNYDLSEAQIEEVWPTADIVLDTNVLLSVFRFSQPTRERLMQIIKILDGRIWIPYHVAIEYHRHCDGLIEQRNVVYQEFKKLVNSWKASVDAVGKLEENLRSGTGHKRGSYFDPSDICRQMEAQIRPVVAEAVEKALLAVDEAQKEDQYNTNLQDIKERLADLLEGKVGLPYDVQTLEGKYAEAQKRFDESIPPGFRDARDKTGNRRYGDAILWFQMIDHARETKRPLIFVTNDTKDDWWRKASGKTLGPHRDLINEMRHQAGVRYHSYTIDAFLQYAEECSEESG